MCEAVFPCECYHLSSCDDGPTLSLGPLGEVINIDQKELSFTWGGWKWSKHVYVPLMKEPGDTEAGKRLILLDNY